MYEWTVEIDGKKFKVITKEKDFENELADKIEELGKEDKVASFFKGEKKKHDKTRRIF